MTGNITFHRKILTIQPGDTVIFENAQDDSHDVMFQHGAESSGRNDYESHNGKER